jgi:hypothetical protein
VTAAKCGHGAAIARCRSITLAIKHPPEASVEELRLAP